jgi:hypothetical protein
MLDAIMSFLAVITAWLGDANIIATTNFVVQLS